MKNLLLTVLFLFYSFHTYAQVHKFSKRQLRELVLIQQRKIIALQSKNEELAEFSSKFHVAEQQSNTYLNERNQLRQKLKTKDDDLSKKDRERNYLERLIEDYKKEIDQKNNLLAVKRNPEYSESGYTKINSDKSSNREVYKERAIYRETTRSYITGPRGGCYYINGNGNKTYVDRSLCR